MPRFTKDVMPKDLLESLDPSIMNVELHRLGHVRLSLDSGEVLSFSEQDLTTLIQFLQERTYGFESQ